jgi:LmbE family N-acetylglucosaminyl deacetylase
MDDLALPRGPILVLAPHPDDESLGCGLLLSEIWRGGGAAQVACVTDGAASHPGSRDWPPSRLAALRRDEMTRALGRLGGGPPDWLGLPDAATDRMHGPGLDMDRALGPVADRVAPAAIVAPSPLDPHCDHETTAAAARRLARARGAALLFYPVWSRWHGRGDAPAPDGTRARRFEGGNRIAKREAIEAHASQMGRIVRDDPDGFAMPDGFAAMFADAPEIYFEAHS